MDEAELARQMEKAELENAEIGGNTLIGSILVIKTNLTVFPSQQVMMINLIWKLREQEGTRPEAGKKQERKAKQKRRNKYLVLLFFLNRYCKAAIRSDYTTSRKFCVLFLPESNDDFADVIALGGILACLLSLVDFEHSFDYWLKVAFVD